MRKRDKWDISEWAEWGFKITPILREVLRESVFDQWIQQSDVSRIEAMILYGKLESLKKMIAEFSSRYFDLSSIDEEMREYIEGKLKPLLSDLEINHKYELVSLHKFRKSIVWRVNHKFVEVEHALKMEINS